MVFVVAEEPVGIDHLQDRELVILLHHVVSFIERSLHGEGQHLGKTLDPNRLLGFVSGARIVLVVGKLLFSEDILPRFVEVRNVLDVEHHIIHDVVARLDYLFG